MTLDELKAQIRIETGRASSRDSELTEYINYAIRDISRSADFRYLRTTGSLSSTSTTRSVTLPTNCGDIISLHYHDTTSGGTEGTRQLHEATPAEARSMFGEAKTGKPYYYIRRPKVNDTAAETLDFWPAPDGAYQFQLEHFEFYTDVTSSSGTNIITTDYPWLIIKRANMRLFNAVGDDDGAARAERQYRQEMHNILMQERRGGIGPPGPLSWWQGAIPHKTRED